MRRPAARATRIRCAIYTRKSTEEGLDQAFNSLHAQREACEAYVRSQAGEGWVALDRAYDDGGFSGGNMDRPGLVALLADIAAGRIDVVVVYKVDRLTRSLADFAKIVEGLDEKGASFVSVTQAFNTTTSMGRLTLNVLLSFAQFEREVTGERIRDKIAASKAKGMWMGGNLPLGYDAPVDPQSRALVVNPPEAEQVRTIFTKYLELDSVLALRDWLAAAGLRSKATLSRRGRQRGGAHLERGALFHLLKNRVYLGEITHKGAGYPGAHPPIIEAELFQAVQDKLAQGVARRVHSRRPTADAPLRGRIFDEGGAPMSPSVSRGKSGRLYRYYVSTRLLQGRRGAAAQLQRISAPIVDALVADRIAELESYPDSLVGVTVGSGGLAIRLDAPQLTPADQECLRRRFGPGDAIHHDDQELVLQVRATLKVRGGRTWAIAPDGRQALRRAVVDRTLVRALGRAHALLRAVDTPPALQASSANASGVLTTYERKLCQIALLAPKLQEAVLDGTQPAGLTLERLINEELPLAWADQLALFQL